MNETLVLLFVIMWLYIALSRGQFLKIVTKVSCILVDFSFHKEMKIKSGLLLFCTLVFFILLQGEDVAERDLLFYLMKKMKKEKHKYLQRRIFCSLTPLKVKRLLVVQHAGLSRSILLLFFTKYRMKIHNFKIVV